MAKTGLVLDGRDLLACEFEALSSQDKDAAYKNESRAIESKAQSALEKAKGVQTTLKVLSVLIK